MAVAYTVFETGVGRCAIAWGVRGVLAVQLPEAREIDTRRNILRAHPDARESMGAPREIEAAIDGVGALLRGRPADFVATPLDMMGQPAFDRRVYEKVRAIPHGEMRTHADIAASLGASGAVYSVGQALARNPFPLLVPCHRARPTPGDTLGRPARGGVMSNYRLLSIEGALAKSRPTLFDVLWPLARPPLQT